jgi:hypothetical protein
MCYVGLTSLKSLKLTNVYPNNKKKSKNNKVKRKPLELYELAGKKLKVGFLTYCCISAPLCANTKLQETKKTHRNTTLLYRHLAQLNHMTYKNILSSYHCNRTWCMAAIIATYFFFAPPVIALNWPQFWIHYFSEKKLKMYVFSNFPIRWCLLLYWVLTHDLEIIDFVQKVFL